MSISGESSGVNTTVSAGQTSNEGDERQYPVQNLVGRRILYRNGIRKVSYRVKWQGYEETTWEPIESLLVRCSHLVYEFHQLNPEYGRSPITRGQIRAGWDGAIDTEPDLWPTYDEVSTYLKKNLPEDCHLIETDDQPCYKEGVNAGVIFTESHAYLAIVLVNYGEVGSHTLVGDSLNSFLTEERREKNKLAGNKILKMLGTTEAEVLQIPTQTRADICAYVAIQTLLETIRLIKTLQRIPALISFPVSEIEKVMNEFGKDMRSSKSLKRGRFEAGLNSHSIQCSYCLDYKCKPRDGDKIKRMHEGRYHHGTSERTANYRSRPVLKYTL